MSTFNEPLSRDDQIVQLEKKYETLLPQKLEDIEKMESLQRLHSQLPGERKNVALEMEHLKRSLDEEFNLLIDLPATVWIKVIRLCSATQNNSLWNVCLASENLEEKIIQNCPSVMEAVIGRKAFAVLVRDYYLDKDDLVNCLTSKCEILEDCAATSWLELQWKNTVPVSKISFKDFKAILRFIEEVKGKENRWEIFVGKLFEFDGSELRTKCEQKEFLTGFNKFLGEFGKFVFCLRAKDVEWMDTEKNFFRNLFGTLRYMQRFDEHHARSGQFQGLYKSNSIRSLEPFYKIYPGRRNQGFFKATVNNCGALHLSYNEVAYFCTLEAEKGFYQNIKMLKIDTNGFQNPCFERILAVDFSAFINLEQVAFFCSEQYLMSLALLAKFPRVREVFLDCRKIYPPRPPVNNPPPRGRFESVRKLTLESDVSQPPPLDDIPEALPSLRYFCLKTESCKLQLKNVLEHYRSGGFFDNYVIDLYHFYADARPLSGSNIWQHMTSLRTLVVESTASSLNREHLPANDRPHRAYTKRREIYSRDEENVIKMQETVLPH